MNSSFNDPSDLDAGLKLSLTAAFSRQYTADEREFLNLLAGMLEHAFPESTEVRRKGLFAKKGVQRLTVTLGERRFMLEDAGPGPLRAARIHIVRGIALKTEAVAVPEWIDEVAAALEERVRTSAAARDALSRWSPG